MRNKIYFKNWIIIFVLFLNVSNVSAQKVQEISEILKDGKKLSLSLNYADKIEITAWDKQEIYIKLIQKVYPSEVYSFKFIKKKSINGISFIEEINKFSPTKRAKSYKNPTFDSFENSIDTLKCLVDYVIFMPKNTKLSAKSISGNFEIRGLKNKIDVETFTGFIDVDIDKLSSAKLNCETDYGAIFSDIVYSEAEVFHHKGVKIKLAHNGGDNKLKLKSTTGDLYIRYVK